MNKLFNLIKQLLVGLVAASLVLSFAWLIYWLFNGGAGLIEESQNPLTNPFLWGAIIIAVVISGCTRLWRVYAERKFIKTLAKQRKAKEK